MSRLEYLDKTYDSLITFAQCAIIKHESWQALPQDNWLTNKALEQRIVKMIYDYGIDIYPLRDEKRTWGKAIIRTLYPEILINPHAPLIYHPVLLLHELAHILLEHSYQRGKRFDELEAEATAYLVLRHHGLHFHRRSSFYLSLYFKKPHTLQAAAEKSRNSVLDIVNKIIRRMEKYESAA